MDGELDEWPEWIDLDTGEEIWDLEQWEADFQEFVNS
jgi:hypothetical protein